MKSAYRKPLIAVTAFALGLGATFSNAATNNCRFAYSFCMPRYNECVANGTPESVCHSELDACILRNGCNILP